jgi:glycosyltransferase involved in cell wall biosynthesis
MKIGLVAQPADGVLPPRQNSIGLIVYNSAVELSASADVTIFLKDRPDINGAADLPFRVERITTPWDDRIENFTAHYPRWARRFGIGARVDEFAGYARKVASSLRRNAVPVAHVMNYWQWSRTIRGSGSRVVLEMQSEWLAQMERDQVARQLAAVDAVVGVSDHISDQFRKAFPEFEGEVATAYNGVDVETFRPAEPCTGESRNDGDGPSVLFVGRVSPEKGVHVLLRAFADVVREVPNARLDLVGPRTELPYRFLAGISDDPLVRGLGVFYDGTVTTHYQRHLDDLVERLGLAANVRFVGSLPHKDLVARYRMASVVVNPSFSESFGISIVEGMASGIPVIGTRIGGMKETVLHGETGLLVDPDRPEALGAAIIEVLTDRRRAEAMGIKGRARAVEQFSWRARASRLARVYEGVVAASGAGA